MYMMGSLFIKTGQSIRTAKILGATSIEEGWPMHAAVFRAARDIGVEQVPEPQSLAAHEVLS